MGKAPKKLGGGPAPDIEDAYDVSCSWYSICSIVTHLILQLADEDPDPVSDDDKKKKSPDDVSNDKLIKAKKTKGKGKK